MECAAQRCGATASTSGRAQSRRCGRRALSAGRRAHGRSRGAAVVAAADGAPGAVAPVPGGSTTAPRGSKAAAKAAQAAAAAAAAAAQTAAAPKPDAVGAASRVPVFVMLPLDTVTRDGTLQKPRALCVGCQTLAKIGVEGVMVDVWWGLVEKEPKVYDWSAYKQLVQMVKQAGLKLTASMSFHACGANVGDVYDITLPGWVLEAAKEDRDLFYADQYGYHNPECLSLFADHAPSVAGRTPLECYRDFMRSFAEEFGDDVGTTITEVSVGCGPCGELRYPAYPENKKSKMASQWRFPGIGEFQCYDKRALGALARAASEANRIEWGGSGPHDSGGYNNWPWETGFFKSQAGSWDSEYGMFFLKWYSGELTGHLDRMLQVASSVFDGTGVGLAIKCAGVHWWYNSRSHAAELTAGYYNTRSGDYAPENNGYEPIVEVCSKYSAKLNFTCVEMRDAEHPYEARCGPEGLLLQVRATAAKHNVPLSGENALCRFDQGAYDRIIENAVGGQVVAESDGNLLQIPPMSAFTFLRLRPEMFDEHIFPTFVQFVRRLKAATTPEADSVADGADQPASATLAAQSPALQEAECSDDDEACVFNV